MMGADRDEETVSSLAGRLARIERQIDDVRRVQIEEVAGVPLGTIIKTFLESIDPDKVQAEAKAATGEDEPSVEAMDQARAKLIGEATKLLTGELVETLDTIRRDLEQTVDHDNLDSVTRAEWSGDADENARNMAQDFEAYLNDNRDKLEALTIFFTQPARRAEVTYRMIQDVLDALKKDRPALSPLRVWRAYAHLDDATSNDPVSELTALVALIRRVCELDDKLTPHSERVRKNFQDWVMDKQKGSGPKFTEEQMVWLRMVRDHLITSFHIERDDLDLSPFDGKGGLGKMYQLFGAQMDEVMAEMNEAVAG
jgi:type I restriction enzyme R subunit